MPTLRRRVRRASVILTAAGPGSDRVRGAMDNTEVFRVMAEALGLAAGQ